MTRTQLTLAAILSLTTLAAPAIACGSRPKTETVTGSFPRIMWTYAPWEQLSLEYPTHSDGSIRYTEDFRVDRDDAFDALVARVGHDNADDLARAAGVRVTLERTIGAKTWHVVRVATTRP